MASTFTQKGEEYYVDWADGTLTPGTHYIHWGTGAGADPPAKGSNALYAAESEARVAAVKSQPLADKNQWVATLVADGPKTITNAGVFSAITGGDLFIHGVHVGTALVLGDKIEYTATLEQT